MATTVFVLLVAALFVSVCLGAKAPLILLDNTLPSDAVYAPGECDASFVPPADVVQRYPPNFVQQELHARYRQFPVCPPPSQRPTYDIVKDFGAVGDNATDNTAVFNKAIATIAANAGGTLQVPAGIFRTKSFNLTSCMQLHLLSHQTVIQAPYEISEWPLIYVEGVLRYADFISGHGLTDMSIIGSGTIDGAGRAFWDGKRARTLKYRRPNLLTVFGSQYISYRDITLRNSPCYNVNPTMSRHIYAADITVINPLDSPNTDGFDPDSCTNATLRFSSITTGDDVIAIKTHDEPSNDILAHNLTATSNFCGFCVGSHAWAGGTNLRLEYGNFITIGHGFCFKGNRGTGGLITNVTSHFVNIGTALQSAIWLWDNYTGTIANSSVVPILDTVTIHRYEVGQVGVAAGIMMGLHDSAITNISIRHFHVHKAVSTPWRCQYINGTYTDVAPDITPCVGMLPEAPSAISSQ